MAARRIEEEIWKPSAGRGEGVQDRRAVGHHARGHDDGLAVAQQAHGAGGARADVPHGQVWCVPAFVAGALVAGRLPVRSSALPGLFATMGLVVGYYGYAEFGRDGMGSLVAPSLWLVMAFLSGPLFGVAGAWWKRGHSMHRRVIGLAALAGVFGMEAILAAWSLHHSSQAWACALLLVLVPLLMARQHRERASTLLTAVLFSPVAYAVIELPLQHVAG
ncbi:DUF6518 family protein [Streptomyces sp. NPDC001634]|uniref:DUF6518 family protein n=1 Tax=Streptomyces sp. NPDC001634 TaxID=3154390 RepID=UPI0033230F4C